MSIEDLRAALLMDRLSSQVVVTKDANGTWTFSKATLHPYAELVLKRMPFLRETELQCEGTMAARQYDFRREIAGR